MKILNITYEKFCGEWFKYYGNVAMPWFVMQKFVWDYVDLSYNPRDIDNFIHDFLLCNGFYIEDMEDGETYIGYQRKGNMYEQKN